MSAALPLLAVAGLLSPSTSAAATTLPSTKIVVPAGSAAVSGDTPLGATATSALAVEFYLFGGTPDYFAKKLCTATLTEVGWLCQWNSTTVPNGYYTLVSEASNTIDSSVSPEVSIAVDNKFPDAPAILGAPTTLIVDDEFTGDSLNQRLWSPDWFGNGNIANNTVMDSENVSVDPNGLELKLAANGTGGLVSSNPNDAQPGHTGFQVAPTPGHPVYVEYRATLPTVGGQIANWPALWLTGQNWPMTGEIDVMEGFGDANWHVITGSSPDNLTNPGGAGALVGPPGGSHTFGVLWSTTGVTFVYDGVIVGNEAVSLTGPMYLVMENSLGDPAAIPATLSVRYVRVWY